MRRPTPRSPTAPVSPLPTCAFGIAAVLKRDAVISTRIGGEGEAVRYVVEGGRAPESSDVFHLSTPVAHWWDYHRCARCSPGTD
jgi:hypothetical protein